MHKKLPDAQPSCRIVLAAAYGRLQVESALVWEPGGCCHAQDRNWQAVLASCTGKLYRPPPSPQPPSPPSAAQVQLVFEHKSVFFKHREMALFPPTGERAVLLSQGQAVGGW